MTSPRALLSVSDKTGIESLGKALIEMGWKIISTGGTANKLTENGLEVTKISDLTGYQEILDGRVKTLNPAIHGGILARRNEESDMRKLSDLGFVPLDLVCVNLYPFEETASKKPPVSDEEIIEKIDIGGPTMIRSAAKNHSDVIVLTNPNQYERIIESLANSEGDPSGVSLDERKELAIEAFHCTSKFDTIVAKELESRFSDQQIPSQIQISSDTGLDLRYGENPHQKARFYPSPGKPMGLSAAIMHSGKPLSYNNYLDLDAALRVTSSVVENCNSDLHVCSIIKHTNPCGAAIDETQTGSWENALASDQESAFGCIIAFNKTIQKDTAEAIGNHFFECIIAPDFEPIALEILSAKRNRRVLTLNPEFSQQGQINIREIDGGWLAQQKGLANFVLDHESVVTEKRTEKEDLSLAKFGLSVISEVKSNAIVLVNRTERGFSTVGIGPGQTSRVSAIRIAARRAGERSVGSMLVSDAFFPFRDTVDFANEIGVKTIVQPGGSIRDQESIDAANEHGLSMIFTGKRLFLH